MSTTKTLDDRRQALEEAFFKKENEKLLGELRMKKDRASQRAALAEHLNLRDEEVLDHLIDVGIRAETWLAISLVPLVEVAWADRKMDPRQRDAIKKAAAEHGIEDGSNAGRLIESWLTVRPSVNLRTAWAEYMAAVTQWLGDAARDALREETLAQAKGIARSTGGFLGIGAHASEEEERVLEELSAAF